MTIGVRWLKKHADHPKKHGRWEWHGSESSHSVEAARPVASVSSTSPDQGTQQPDVVGDCALGCGVWAGGAQVAKETCEEEGAMQRPVCPEAQFTQRASGWGQLVGQSGSGRFVFSFPSRPVWQWKVWRDSEPLQREARSTTGLSTKLLDLAETDGAELSRQVWAADLPKLLLLLLLELKKSTQKSTENCFLINWEKSRATMVWCDLRLSSNYEMRLSS